MAFDSVWNGVLAGSHVKKPLYELSAGPPIPVRSTLPEKNTVRVEACAVAAAPMRTETARIATVKILRFEMPGGGIEVPPRRRVANFVLPQPIVLGCFPTVESNAGSVV